MLPNTTKGVVKAVLDKAFAIKLSNKDLANNLGVTVQTLYHWKKGIYAPDGDNILRLLKFLNET